MKQHKHKKCMCKHKQKLESAFNGVTIIAAGPPPTVGGRNNVDDEVEEKPSLSRQYATNWWKLKLADRKAHNELMKVQLLSPFLFCKVYQGDSWLSLAKKAGLLSDKRVKSLDDLTDEEIYTTDLMEDTLLKLQERIIEFNNIKPNNKPIYAYLEEILDDIKSVEDTFSILKNPMENVDNAIKLVYKKHWFRAVRKQLPAKYADKHDYAVFLVAWQVCFYIKSVYHEKPLDIYESVSELSSDMEVYKQQGNEYFENKDYVEAVKTYTTILSQKPFLYIIYGNRALCYLKIEKFRSALSDGRRAIALNPKWDKGYFRYARALYELGKFDETVNVLAKATKIFIVLPPILQSIQKDVKRAIAEKNSPTLIADAAPPAAKAKESISDVDDPKYANMPELETDNSDNESDSNHSDDEAKHFDKKLDTKKENTKKKKKKKSKSKETPPTQLPPKIYNEKTKIMTVMQEASKYLLDSKIEFAIREYRKVFSMTQADPNTVTKMDVAVLHYALGWAYQESSSLMLQDSLQQFAEIKRKYRDINFPLAFYGKGIVYHKQNRFKECIIELQEALRLCNLPDCILNCCWPGIDEIIEVSIPENFRLAVDHFITLCSHPPRPDAVCRYLSCNCRTTSIYYTDPDFKGFLRMVCTENCFIEFHSPCWKKYKSEQDSHPSEKDFLSQACLTPDCYGAILSLKIFDSSRKVTKELTVKDSNLLKKELRQKEVNIPAADMPHSKKRKKDNSVSSNEDSVNWLPKEEKQRRSRKSSNLSDGDDSLISTKHSDSKSDKENKHPDCCTPEEIDLVNEADYFNPSFDISKYNSINGVKLVALKIFVMFEKLLMNKGMVDLGNGTANRNFMNSLDDSGKLLIVQAGSLRSLLNSCPKFVFDAKNKNTVRLYEKLNNMVENSAVKSEKSESAEKNGEETNIDSTVSLRNKSSSECSEQPANESNQEDDLDTSLDGIDKSSQTSPIDEKTCESQPEINHAEDVEVVDCTKSNTDIFTKSVSRNKKLKKKVSDIIIFNDSKKGGDITCKVIRTPDGPRPEPPSPRKDKKAKNDGEKASYKKIDENVYKLKHDRPSTPPGEKSNLRSYLEDKIEAEKVNKQPKYCCPLLGNNCSCAEIERFCEEDGGKTRVRVMKVITIEPEGKDSDSDEDSNQAVANALEMIHGKHGGNQGKSRKRTPSCESICVVEVGIQCDSLNLKKVEGEKEQFKMFNEDLIKRLKESQALNDKLSLEKEEQARVIENKNAENKSHKSSLEKLRKELQLSRNNTQDEVKKVENNYLSKVESLSKQVDSLDKEKRDLSSARAKAETDLRAKEKELRTKDTEIKALLKSKAEELRLKTEEVKSLKLREEDIRAKDEEIRSLKTSRETLQAKVEVMKEDQAQEKRSHEEIVNRLTNSVTEQSNRTQKVQIAFLEVKKEIVAVKYQQQAAVVQNTINQMQFWPMVPEVQNIRSVWDEFKKQFQTCYEKMQEEFRMVIQKVKDGEPLEDLPPAQYSEPPPFPKTPMPNNIPMSSPYFGQPATQGMAASSTLMAPSQLSPNGVPPPPGISIPKKPIAPLNVETSSSASSSPIHGQGSAASSLSPVSSVSSASGESSMTKLSSSPVSSPSPTNVNLAKNSPSSSQGQGFSVLPSSSKSTSKDTKLSFASSVKQGASSDHMAGGKLGSKNAETPEIVDDPDEPKRKMFDRIIMRLGSIFPSFSRDELCQYVVDYRKMQPQGSLSGKKFDDLIMSLEKMIRSNKDATKTSHNGSKKKIDVDAVNRAVAKQRTRASHAPLKNFSQSKESSWPSTSSTKAKTPEGYGEEEPCVICYEDMARETVSKLNCGHFFHRSCITCWLNEQRTCPICRVHALLPEEYPTLA